MVALVAANTKELKEINVTLQRYIDLKTWTPAMGAMLMCGIGPVGRPIDVKGAVGVSLRYPLSPAYESQAERVLDYWIEIYIEEHEGSREDALDILLDPYDYISWCHEYFEHEGNFLRPGWLNYWEAFLDWEYQNNEAPIPVPKKIVDRLEALEHMVSDEVGRHPRIYSLAKAGADEKAAYVDRVCASIEATGRSPIKSQIIEALNSTSEPKNGHAVWAELRRLAIVKKYPFLVYVNATSLKIPSGSGWKDYDVTALQQFLRKHDKKSGTGQQAVGQK